MSHKAVSPHVEENFSALNPLIHYKHQFQTLQMNVISKNRQAKTATITKHCDIYFPIFPHLFLQKQGLDIQKLGHGRKSDSLCPGRCVVQTLSSSSLLPPTGFVY